jgi:hypothetical protein
MHEKKGFPGMLGSIDCMHWQWKNCPAALAGQYKGKEKKPTVVLEAWVSTDLWIWHCNFGSPGSLSDLNILDQSPVFNSIMKGKAPRAQFQLNGKPFYMPYLLADGIYPDWPVFMKTIESPNRQDAMLFSKMQEAQRKDVERAFGVLQARWHILSIPCRLWSQLDTGQIMKACIILHNMIIEDQAKDGENDEGEFWMDPNHHVNGFMPSFVVDRPRTLDRPRSIADLVSTLELLQNSNLYRDLQANLISHLWLLFASSN